MAIDTKAIFAEVKANQAKLNSCVGHDFLRIEDKIFSKYRCSVCNGTVSGDAAFWYNKGVEHTIKDRDYKE